MPHVDRAFPFKKLIKYPGLRPLDLEIWEVFIATTERRFKKVWYNWHVGDPAETHANCEECVNNAWEDLTRWKIDAVLEDESAFYVVEVKPHARATALGQAKSYTHLFKEEVKPVKPVFPVVLTDLIISTTQRMADKEGILLWGV